MDKQSTAAEDGQPGTFSIWPAICHVVERAMVCVFDHLFMTWKTSFRFIFLNFLDISVKHQEATDWFKSSQSQLYHTTHL